MAWDRVAPCLVVVLYVACSVGKACVGNWKLAVMFGAYAVAGVVQALFID